MGCGRQFREPIIFSSVLRTVQRGGIDCLVSSGEASDVVAWLSFALLCFSLCVAQSQIVGASASSLVCSVAG